MKNNYKKIMVALVTFLSPFAVLSQASAATGSQQLEITPTSLVASFDKGTTSTETITVINPGTVGNDIKIYATPFSVSGENYSQNFNPIPNAENVSNWFSFSKSIYHIDAGQTLEIPYTIKVPSSALAGGHYATIFVETNNSANINGVVIHDRLGSIAYLTVNGPVKISGNFLSWSVPYLQRPDLTASVRVQNTGGVHFQSTLNATIQDVFGSTKYKFYTQHEILPQTIRQISPVWPKTPSFGLYKISGSIQFLDQTVKLPGKYVLVMSSFVRMIVLILILLIAVWIVVKIRFSGGKGSQMMSKLTNKKTVKKAAPKKKLKNKKTVKKSKK